MRQVERAEVIPFDLTHSPTVVDLPPRAAMPSTSPMWISLTITDQIMETDAAPGWR
ncbi:hypothetical protein [Candidatus Amarolinea dominans]|uniref:hypothetical protein n=1 Tax=Candidatus Amarolinea dominans TaxID=3140696 RepID=UPI003135B276|nr:hypothetical protein [Anaerolineae bacterium]